METMRAIQARGGTPQAVIFDAPTSFALQLSEAISGVLELADEGAQMRILAFQIPEELEAKSLLFLEVCQAAGEALLGDVPEGELPPDSAFWNH